MDSIQRALEGLTAAPTSVAGDEPGGMEYDEADPDQCGYRMVVQGQCLACGHFHGEPCLVCDGFHGL